MMCVDSGLAMKIYLKISLPFKEYQVEFLYGRFVTVRPRASDLQYFFLIYLYAFSIMLSL